MYPFALDNIKLQRAIGAVGTDPVAVRKEYEKIGGRMAEEVITISPSKPKLVKKTVKKVAKKVKHAKTSPKPRAKAPKKAKRRK